MTDTIMIHGIEMIRQDDSIVSSFVKKGHYENQSIEFMKKHLKPDEVFIDVGSYSGLYAILSAKRGISSIAFEPVKKHYQRLLDNVSLNNVQDLVTTYNCAILNEDVTQKPIYFTNKTVMNSAARFEENDNGSEIVDVTNTFHSIPKVCCMKIDVENSELSVLEVMDDIIKRDHPALIIETLTDRDEIELMRVLEKYKYRFEKTDIRNMLCY